MSKLKKKLFYHFNNLDYNKILGYDIAVFKGTKALKNKSKDHLLDDLFQFCILFKNLLGTIYRSIFTYPEIKYSKNKKIFYIRSQSISYLIPHSISYEKIDGTTVCLISKRVKKINLRAFFCGVYLIFKLKKSWIKVLNNNGINFYSVNGFKIFLILFSSLSDSIKIFPLLSKYSNVVSFQECCQVENMICQLANLINIKTFALEHGIGTFRLKGPYWQRIPLRIYLSSVCKNVLCWGKFSKILFRKYTNANVYIIGKSSLPKKTKNLNGVTIIFQHQNWKAANKKLIDIGANLESINIPVSYWFKGENFLEKKNKTRTGPLRKIVLGNSSNLLAELGYLGLQVYLLKNSVFLEFLNNSSILLKIEKIKSQYLGKKKYPKYIWKSFIECTGSESIKRYKKILLNNN